MTVNDANGADHPNGKPIRPHRPPAMTAVQYADARARYLAGESAESIAADIGCKRGTLDSRFSREGLPQARLAQLANGRGARTKEKIAAVAESLVDAMGERVPKSADGMNLHADTLNKVARAAALVHGWGTDVNVAVIVAGDIGGRAPDQEQAIDV